MDSVRFQVEIISFVEQHDPAISGAAQHLMVAKEIGEVEDDRC